MITNTDSLNKNKKGFQKSIVRILLLKLYMANTEKSTRRYCSSCHRCQLRTTSQQSELALSFSLMLIYSIFQKFITKQKQIN